MLVTVYIGKNFQMIDDRFFTVINVAKISILSIQN